MATEKKISIFLATMNRFHHLIEVKRIFYPRNKIKAKEVLTKDKEACNYYQII